MVSLLLDLKPDSSDSTYEIRNRTVQAVERGGTVTAAADAFGVARRTLHRWLERHESTGVNGLQRQAGSGRPHHPIEHQEKKGGL